MFSENKREFSGWKSETPEKNYQVNPSISGKTCAIKRKLLERKIIDDFSDQVLVK